MGIQIARAMGLRVVGIDGGDAKRSLCIELGCEAFIDFTKSADVAEEVVKVTDGKGAHGVIVTASNSPAYNMAIKMLRTGGILMCVGLRKSLPALSNQITNRNILSAPTKESIAGADPAQFVLKQVHITGTLVGTRLSTDKCLELASRVCMVSSRVPRLQKP